MPGPNANGFASQWNMGLRLSQYSTKNQVRVGYPMRMKLTKKHEMYMANASPNARTPNATYIPLALRWVCKASRWLLGYRNGLVGGLNQHDDPMRMVLHCSGI